MPHLGAAPTPRTQPRAELRRSTRPSHGDSAARTRGSVNSLETGSDSPLGPTGQITKGGRPWNKGRKTPPGKGGNHPNARKTQFKTGVRQGIATKLYKPIGTERMSNDGYLERKIHDGMPLQSRWRAIHLIRWEEKNGKLPKDMCLKCLDGNRQNTEPDNWAIIPRGTLPFLNGNRSWSHNYDEMPSELKPTVLALARLKHAKSKAGKRVSKRPS